MGTMELLQVWLIANALLLVWRVLVTTNEVPAARFDEL